jgi:hypothetical protein
MEFLFEGVFWILELLFEVVLHFIWQVITWPFRKAHEWAENRFDW